MTMAFDEEDPLVRALRALPPRDVPPGRAEAIRRRCARELAHRARARRRAVCAPGRHWRLVLEPTIVAGLGAMFLVEVARRAVALY